jgi:hypothetical protein
MSRSRSDFKSTHVYGWEHEPHDERPSEFAQSTGYRLHSGFYVAPVTQRRSGGSALVVWLAASAVVGVAVAAMFAFVKLLQA